MKPIQSAVSFVKKVDTISTMKSPDNGPETAFDDWDFNPRHTLNYQQPFFLQPPQETSSNYEFGCDWPDAGNQEVGFDLPPESSLEFMD